MEAQGFEVSVSSMPVFQLECYRLTKNKMFQHPNVFTYIDMDVNLTIKYK